MRWSYERTVIVRISQQISQKATKRAKKRPGLQAYPSLHVLPNKSVPWHQYGAIKCSPGSETASKILLIGNGSFLFEFLQPISDELIC